MNLTYALVFSELRILPGSPLAVKKEKQDEGD